MKLSKKIVEDFFYQNYYIADELLTYYTLIALKEIKKGKMRIGQDIYTTCLDGPPGAGKSMYAKLYAKMVHEILKEEVVLISYQCDDSTSKIELFEDINVGAAVASIPEKVNIPGVLAKAIIEVNKGKKVILFIDEYDKTREQVDSLFLQMLQNGMINTNQFGDLAIKDEYKGNIQVIFCKNDFRTELTGPLTRRMRVVSLDIMKPIDFRELAIRVLYHEADEKQELTIIDFVSLVYEEIYKMRNELNRVCAPSELFGAIQDLTSLIEEEAPNDILFQTLIGDLLKNKEDAEIFKTKISQFENEALKKTLLTLQIEKAKKQSKNVIDLINDHLKEQAKIAAEQFLEEEREKIKAQQKNLLQEQEKVANDKTKLEAERETFRIKAEGFLKEIETKFTDLIKKKEMNNSQINLSPLSSNNYALNFDDCSNFLRRGRNVFEIIPNTTLVATLSIPKVKFHIQDLIHYFLEQNHIVYENGFYIREPYPMILVRDNMEEDGKITFRVFMNEEFLKEEAKNKDGCLKEEIAKLFNVIISLNGYSLNEIDMSYLENFYSYRISGSTVPPVYQKVLEKHLPS